MRSALLIYNNDKEDLMKSLFTDLDEAEKFWYVAMVVTFILGIIFSFPIY